MVEDSIITFMKNKDVPDSTIIRCLIRDNKCLLAKIKQLEQQLDKELKDQDKKYTQKCQEFANYKAQSKEFYSEITKEGINQLLKEVKKYRKEEINRLRKEVDQLHYVIGKYARTLQEHNLLKEANE